MKYVTIAEGDGTVVGRLAENGIEIQRLADNQGNPLSNIIDLIELRYDPVPFGETLSLNKVNIRAPIPRPSRNIFCVGKNYADHAKEFTGSGFDSGNFRTQCRLRRSSFLKSRNVLSPIMNQSKLTDGLVSVSITRVSYV